MNEVTANVPAAAAEALDGFTTAEFTEIAASGILDFAGKVELIDGVIVKMAPASMRHSLSNFSVAQRLTSVYPGFGIGIDLGVEINGRTLLGIDVAVVKADAPKTGFVRGDHVLLAVEIADSTLNKDLKLKADAYANAGIADYWVVDVQARVVHVMNAPEGGRYARRIEVKFGDPIEAPGASGKVVID